MKHSLIFISKGTGLCQEEVEQAISELGFVPIMVEATSGIQIEVVPIPDMNNTEKRAILAKRGKLRHVPR